MRWNEKDLNFLRANYPSKGTKYCADALGRTINSCAVKASELHLRRNINGSEGFDMERPCRGIPNAHKQLFVGMTVGRLTLVEPTLNRNAGGEIIWKCSCICGGTRFVSSGDLRKNATISCGCFRKEIMKYPPKMRKRVREEVLNGMR